MDFNQLTSKNSGPILLVLLLAVFVLMVIGISQALQLRNMKSQWKSLLVGSDGRSIEALLQDHLNERIRQEEDQKKILDTLNVLERKMETAKRYVGVVRYDAFQDVTGQQSFSMAIYDEKGDGAVMTCQIGRVDCRVYSKVLEGGKSDRTLTIEEQQAIEAASTKGRKVRVQ